MPEDALLKGNDKFQFHSTTIGSATLDREEEAQKQDNSPVPKPQ
jgi:hypothetical protein